MKAKILDMEYNIKSLSPIIFKENPEINKFSYMPITIQLSNEINTCLLENSDTIEIISYQPNTNAIIVYDGYEIKKEFIKLYPIRYCSIITN